MAIQEQFILLGLGLATIIIRVAIRTHSVGITGWKLDDYMIIMTAIVFTLETVAAYLVGAKFQGLTNSYMTDAERAALDPDSREYYNRQWGSKIQIMGWSAYVFILWSLKFCVAGFYGRLSAGLERFRSRVLIAYVLLTVTYIGVALTIVLSCQPFHHFWQIYPDPGALCRPTNSPAYVFVAVIPNILTDMYLLSIPLPMLWGVNISIRRRLTLIFLFSGAIFIMIASTIRAVTISTAGPDGAVSGSSWACRETYVAIFVTNIPIIHPVIRRLAVKMGLSGIFSRSSPTGAESHQLPGRSKSGATGTFDNPNHKRHAHPLSIPNNGSDEEILVSGGAHPGASKVDAKGIVVDTEITVQSTHYPEGRRRSSSGNAWSMQAPKSSMQKN